MASRYKSQAERRSSRRSMKAFWTSALAVVASAAAVFGVAAPLYAQNDGAAKIRVVKPFIGYEETYQWSDVPEIIAEGARSEEGESALDYAWASDLFFNKQIWQLQFAYKSVRTIDVNYPTADGKLQSRRIWYMVYSVTNTGRELKLVQDSSVPSNVTRTIVLINKGRVLAHGDVHEVRALIDAHPHSVTVRCGQPRKLATALVATPHVVNVEFDENGGAVTVHTRDANTFYDEVNVLLADPVFAVESVHSPDDNLQAVFEYLVR